MRFASDVRATRPFGSFVRDGNGAFRQVASTDQPSVSPDGTWVALIPWVKFANSEMDHVEFLNRTTGEKFRVTTVKRPRQTMLPTWSRDGGRLLLSIQNEDRSLNVGFVVVDVRTRKATVVTTEFAQDSLFAFAFTPDGRVARGYYNGKRHGVEIYDMSGRVTRTLHWVGSPRGTDWYSPSGALFTTACPEGRNLCVWNSTTGDRGATVPWDEKEGRVIGWFNEDHLIVEHEAKDRREVHIVNLVGESRRMLAEIDLPSQALGQFAPVPR